MSVAPLHRQSFIPPVLLFPWFREDLFYTNKMYTSNRIDFGTIHLNYWKSKLWMLSCQFENALFLLVDCLNRLSFNSNECPLQQLKLIYFKLYLKLYCGNILMQRKPGRRGGERWASLIPSEAAQAVGRQMFFLWFCNLTTATGEVGVPCSESKVEWPGRESKWNCFILASWKENKKGIWVWRGKGRYRLWRILEPKAVFSKLKDKFNFPSNVC